MKIVLSFNIHDRLVHACGRVFTRRNLIITAMLFFAATLAYSRAQITQLKTFANGDVIYADDLNENFNLLFDKANTISMVDIENVKKLLFSEEREGGQYIGVVKRFEEWNALIDAQIDVLESGSVPVGIIAMWDSSDTPPPGWAMCDGNNGRPNLKDKFIVGAGKDETEGEGKYKVNTTDAESKHTHDITHTHIDKETALNSTTHNHLLLTYNRSDTGSELLFYDNTDNHALDVNLGDTWTQTSFSYFDSTSPRKYLPFAIHENSGIVSAGKAELYTTNAGEHSHEIEFKNDGTRQSKEQITTLPEQVSPPYYALHYIIKCDPTGVHTIKCN